MPKAEFPHGSIGFFCFMQTELKLAYKKFLYDNNQKRIKEQEKQYAYYSGNKDSVLLYLDRALEITYKSDDIEEMQKQFLNLTEKVIKQMAVVYRDPATRTLDTDDLTDYYDSILPDNINTIDKEAHRLAKLHGVSITFVTHDTKGNIKYVVRPSYLYDVEVDEEDETLLKKISYPKYYKDANGEEQEFTVVWTDTELYRLDANGNPSPIPTRNNTQNPYGIIPAAVLRLGSGLGFWTEGLDDLVNVNEQVNLLLTKLVNSDIILGTEGTTLGINLGLKKKGQNEDGVRIVRTGRKHPITVEDVNDTMQRPSLEHITTDPHIVEISDYIDWYITKIATLKGLNPNAVLSIVKDTSDYQKMMDAVDQLELRRDDIEPCRIYEKQRFEITRTINNSLVGTEFTGYKEIPETDFNVDFADIEIQMTPEDKRKQREWELQHGMSSPVDWLMEDNPDLDEEGAQEILDKNKQVRNGLKRSSTLENILGGVNDGNR